MEPCQRTHSFETLADRRAAAREQHGGDDLVFGVQIERAVLGLLVWVSLRRRNQCSLAGVRQRRWRLLGVLAVAVGTYVALYAVTTWLGGFA